MADGAETGLAFVLVQHLDPDHKTMLQGLPSELPWERTRAVWCSCLSSERAQG